MSTILKALRRLEQEKTRSGGRPLREEVVVTRSPSRRRAAWWALAGASALAFTATFLLLRELRHAVPATSTPPPVAAGPAGPGTAPLPRVAPARPARAVPMPAAAPPEPAATLAPEAPPLPLATRRDPDPDVALVRPMEGRPSRVVEEAAAPVVRRPDAATEPASRLSRHVAPIRVVRTSWHPLPARRAAWVEWGAEGVREVREGGRVGPYQVREIEPDAVLFAEGTALLRRRIGGQ